jgi:hypothetical protein
MSGNSLGVLPSGALAGAKRSGDEISMPLLEESNRRADGAKLELGLASRLPEYINRDSQFELH